MSHSSSSNVNIQDIITEESPPAYTQYPNLGEQSMAFGPNRPFENNTTQSVPQQQQIIYQAPNQHINQPPLQNYNAYFHNNNSAGGGNVIYSVVRPTFTTTNTIIPVIPINSQVNTSILRYPPGYVCSKCNNTGYKGPGKMCKDCWRSFGFHPTGTTTYSSPGINNSITQITRPQQSNIVYARPGDPSIGGRLCPICQGSGKGNLYINQQLCPGCQGIGRVFT
ncbi:365_t:CDS:2 [Funneliformis geosporum]|uniref:1755_t:CDS:1 n=1 Tax=Funneliformis geosporum TaxID=1117311 RepID=A0A9W4T1V9_9GLOM|nr:1755_t:CDS:2 [Funneliformis geosporum]CAI2190056.1 365_t:CDS:2 [Funneliformis geosporum]